MDYSDRYYEARQHLNLSQEAFDVVSLDKYDFQEKPSLASMLNRIFTLYRDDADASIEAACNRFELTLEEQLSKVGDSPGKRTVIEALRNAHKDELLEKAASYPREHAFKFAYLAEWAKTDEAYDGVAGRFIKAVIEEYARKPYVEREKIIFAERIRGLEGCCEAHQTVILTLRNGKRYEVKPYRVCIDKGNQYNYLVGLSRKAGTKEEEQLASFRISKLYTYKTSSKSGKITEAQKKEIEDRLRSVGVQFLLKDPEIIRIRLSPYGNRMYETQAHLRPQFHSRSENPDGSWNYELLCTQLQVEYYFFKFGAEAEILSPSELRVKFERKYESALAVYRR